MRFNSQNSALILLCAIMLSCSNSGYELTKDGVIVDVVTVQDAGARKVRIEVMGEKLMHVSATPEKKFADTKSLVIVPGGEKTPFQVEDLGETVAVKTSALTATVNKATGQVIFIDATGKQLLAEEEGGRTFQPFEADGKQAYSVIERNLEHFLQSIHSNHPNISNIDICPSDCFLAGAFGSATGIIFFSAFGFAVVAVFTAGALLHSSIESSSK